jgi:hypothetical protein
LRRIAREIANSRADAAARDLADKLRAIAATLENPKVPPETKLEQLASVEHQLKAQQQRNQQQEGSSGKGQTGGKGTQGQGAGQGKGGSGQGQDQAGPAQGKGSGKGSGGTGQSKSGENQIAEARKDIAKVQAQLEAEAAKQKSPKPSDTNGLKARAPRPGEKPDLAMAESINNPNLKQLKDLSQIKSNREHGQEPNSNRSAQSGQPRRKDFGSSKGDTHLGQFPEPGNFERFYKAGEHGLPMDVKNARYVLFRIPPAVQRGGGGKAVVDNDRPSATVPYENLPLNAERIAADPDEHQLVPPRYRDLLR